MLWIIFAVAPWMLIAGYVLSGLAVGADVPASWTLIAEQAPPETARTAQRGGATAVELGPVVVLMLALALSGLGVLGIRIVFAHLLVVSLVLWALRRRMHESSMWAPRDGHVDPAPLSRRHLGAAVPARDVRPWNLKAGTGGFFLPYLLRTLGAQTQAAERGPFRSRLRARDRSHRFVFMRLVDRVDQRRMFGSAMALQAASVLVLAVLPLGVGAAAAFVALTGLSGGFGPQAFFQLWSAESFPTAVRTTALGLMFAASRIALGLWSLFVPGLAEPTCHHAGVAPDFGFVVVSAILGLISRLPRFALGGRDHPYGVGAIAALAPTQWRRVR